VIDPVTFVFDDEEDNVLLARIAARKLLIAEAEAEEESFGFSNWSPVTPGPPPIYTARLSGQFINRAPVRYKRPDDEGLPQKQDRRQTSNTERVSILLNALLRRADIIRVGIQDFRLSWIPPSMTGAEAPNLTIFLDTTTGLLSIKDINGVVIPIGTGGAISFDFGGP